MDKTEITLITILMTVFAGNNVNRFVNAKRLAEQHCDPEFQRILPQDCLTEDFYDQLNTHVANGNYDAAVNSFLNPDEREYSTTLGASYDAREQLVRSLDLQPFLANVEVCGTADTPSCEDLVIDPSCGCPVYDYNTSAYIAEHISSIRLQPEADPTSGFVEVRFDQGMQYIFIESDEITTNMLVSGLPYRTRFLPHWEADIEYQTPE
ncbi:hypothetical protein COV16_02285 [Candidatus Woesearchaeota archaeon CG10_big_fil_rev_8_21_14_0_10_34_8]|nr:MAG: hypothetical protein COV16_02285 [Candidatus Woesearchaeota archaeon CG10_big_fil_rev_8_21_14_0_10_34_8]